MTDKPKRTKINTTLADDLLIYARVEAAKRNLSANDIIEEALRLHRQHNEEKASGSSG